MNEKIKKLIDCMVQLREAMKGCEDVISCELRDGYFFSNKTGCQDGIKATIQMVSTCGIYFDEKAPFSQEYDERYTVVNGVKIFCLEDKEEA